MVLGWLHRRLPGPAYYSCGSGSEEEEEEEAWSCIPGPGGSWALVPDGSWVLEALDSGPMDQVRTSNHTKVPSWEEHKASCRTWGEEKVRVQRYLLGEEHTSRRRTKEGKSRLEEVEPELAKTSDASTQNCSCSATTSRSGCARKSLPM